MTPGFILLVTELILQEAYEHLSAYMQWRHNPARPQLGVCRLLPQDLGYLADEREFCPHCQENKLEFEVRTFFHAGVIRHPPFAALILDPRNF